MHDWNETAYLEEALVDYKHNFPGCRWRKIPLKRPYLMKRSREKYDDRAYPVLNFSSFQSIHLVYIAFRLYSIYPLGSSFAYTDYPSLLRIKIMAN